MRTSARSRRQFHHLVRTIPASGRILVERRGREPEAHTLAMGAWTPRESFRARAGAASPGRWTCPRAGLLQVRGARKRQARGHGEVGHAGRAQRRERAGRHRRARGTRRWPGVSAAALGEFKGVQTPHGTARRSARHPVYDDFAHHPTAIATTLDGLRRKVGAAHRRRARAAFRHHAHGRASRHSGAVAGRCRRSVDVRAPGSGLGCRRGGESWAPRGLAATLDELLEGLAAELTTGRPGAHHEQRRLRRPARQTTRGAARRGPP